MNAKEKSVKKSSLNNLFTYIPPNKGAPRFRSGAASRGVIGKHLITPIAPVDIALTATPQPVLYWYISDSIDNALQLAIVNEDTGKFIAKVVLPGHYKRGIYHLDLKKKNISLSAHVLYNWYVVIANNKIAKKTDALIQYNPLPGRLAKQATHSNLKQAKIFARTGYWYDAIATLGPLNSLQANNQRIHLFNQVELTDVAKYSEQIH